MSRSLVTLLTLAAALLGAAAPASAAPSMAVGASDDRLLAADDASAARTAAEWRQEGVDTVRIVARWGAIAPAPNDTAPPAGFDAADPSSPGYDWRSLDRAVGAVTGQGMRVVLTVTGWGPVWGSESPARRNPRWKPSPARFAAFATAVARRYGAVVDAYIVFNEPNVSQWLQPQSSCTSGGRCTPASPHLYRALYAAAEPAIRAADPGARVLAGALAPRGTSGAGTNANLRPLVFLRALGCVDGRYRRIRTGPCRGFRPIVADELAYHPHGLKLAPTAHDPNRDQAQIGDLGRLTSALDRIQRAGGLRVRGAAHLPLFLDEFAYQTNPPDRVLGISPATQSRWMQEGAWLAWRNPRVTGLVWYVWRDEPLGALGSGWQSGLRYADGRAKPALAAFAHPIWAWRRDRHTIGVWGQARPGEGTTATIERRSGFSWTTVATVSTDAHGGFQRTIPATGPATVRYRWDAGVSDAMTVR